MLAVILAKVLESVSVLIADPLKGGVGTTWNLRIERVWVSISVVTPSPLRACVGVT